MKRAASLPLANTIPLFGSTLKFPVCARRNKNALSANERSAGGIA